MIKRRFIKLCLVIFLLVLVTRVLAQDIPSNSNIAAQFKQLKQGISVLYIAAHPDDENTQLLTYFTKVKKYRTAYLSLTRGDGGQNLIGSEQGIALGVVRTHELAQARKIDGAEQFFTRAYDFGYSKTSEETFENWDKTALLSDVVFVIRKFKPTVIITRFDIDGSGGHGQHTAAAILAYEAFKLAADPNQFPEQLKYVAVHKCKRIFYNSISNWLPGKINKANLIPLEIGHFIPELGENTGEIAAESRSMHLSQGFGTEKKRGKQTEYFKPIDGDTLNLNNQLFNGIAPEIDALDPSLQLKKALLKAEKHWQANDIKQCNVELFGAIQKLTLLGMKPSHPFQKQLKHLLMNVNGIYVESVYKQHELPVSGDSILIDFEIIARKSEEVILKRLTLGHEAIPIVSENQLQENKPNVFSKKILLNNEQYSNLFWLEKGIKSNLYDIPLPIIGTDLNYTFTIPVTYVLQIGKDSIVIENNVVQKEVIPQVGEIYRPLVVCPPLLLNLPKQLYVAKKGKTSYIAIGLKAYKTMSNLQLAIEVPFGWYCKYPDTKININKAAYKTLMIELFATDSAKSGTIAIKAFDSIQTYALQQETVEYPHIGKQVYFTNAVVKAIPNNFSLSNKKIGYIVGAKDQTPTILKELGYQVELIDANKFAETPIADYAVLIFGIRSFNLYPQLHQFREQYLSFVKEGGNVLVLYQTNTFLNELDKTIGPYPFGISKERTTNEHATMNYTAHNKEFLSKPNPMTPTDFEGWVQERGIYYANAIDSAYQSPFEIADFNEVPNKGALIVANYGKGKFTYTGLSFFRQFPAGVSGAIKLLINLIEQ